MGKDAWHRMAIRLALVTLTGVKRVETTCVPVLESGFCVNERNEDINHQIHKHPDNAITQQTCLEWCSGKLSATGCEHIINRSNKGCYYFTTKDIRKGNGANNHVCWIFHTRSRECHGCAASVGVSFVPSKVYGCDYSWTTRGLQNAEPACAAGFHVCSSENEAKSLGVTEGDCASKPPPGALYLSHQGSPYPASDAEVTAGCTGPCSEGSVCPACPRDDRPVYTLETHAIERSYDYPGDDLKLIDNVASVEACQNLCTDEPRCKSFVYIKKPGQAYTRRCCLKHSVKPNRQPNDCCDSGIPATGTGKSRLRTTDPFRVCWVACTVTSYIPRISKYNHIYHPIASYLQSVIGTTTHILLM